MSSIGAPYVSADYKVKEGSEQDFIVAWQELASLSFGEGLSKAELVQCDSDPQLFRSMSLWASDEARDATFAQPAVAEMLERLTEMCSEITRTQYILRATSTGLRY